MNDDQTDDWVVLEFNDWNYQDKYYEVPRSIFNEFKEKCHKSFSEAWDWFIEKVDYDNQGIKPIKFGTVNMTLDRYFLAYDDVQNCLNEWASSN